MASSVTSCVSACSTRVPLPSTAPGASGRCRDDLICVGVPSIFPRVVSGGSSLRLGGVVRKRRSRLVTVAASVEEGVKDTGSSETSAASTDSPKVELPSKPTSRSPFESGGKISSIAAAKQGPVDSKIPESAEGTSAFRKQTLVIGAKQPTPVGQLSPKVAEQLKVSKAASVSPQGAGATKPASPFAQPGGAKPSSAFTGGAARKPLAEPGAKPASPFVQPGARGKRVVDAFKEGEKDGKTTKFGQPVVPSNIFQDVRRTPEEIAADAFKFSISPGQLVLVGSFLLIIGLMVGTAFVVWKLGGIHYNEY